MYQELHIICGETIRIHMEIFREAIRIHVGIHVKLNSINMDSIVIQWNPWGIHVTFKWNGSNSSIWKSNGAIPECMRIHIEFMMNLT